MNDGWDDDDDLDITLEEDNNNAPAHQQGAGGWEKDEELFDDEDGDNDDANQGNAAAEGWDEDEDDLNLDDDDWDDNNNNNNKQAPTIPHPPQGSSEPEDNTFGAGFQIPAADNEGTSGAYSNAASGGGGWEEDEELFANSDDGEDPSPPPSKTNILQELEDYVGSLSRMLSSINAILEFEYNTPEKAQELLEYYSARPGLAEYTRTKEVPRMNYQVILPGGHVETDKQTIANHHLPDHSLIARCANQSILADLLHVLTGPDLVVRQQFLAICVAQMCQFRLHYGDGGRDMLQCNCMLQLSLPVEEGPRLNIATIRTTVAFSPKQHEPPMVKFQVDKIIVTLKESQYSQLQKVADFLTMMEGHLNELPGHEDLYLQNAPADIFRDAFLEQSQQLLTQSKAGMKSALKDMESVIGLKSKFKAVRGGISRFLPDTNVLLAAEEEARALAAHREAQPKRLQAEQSSSRPVAPPHPPSHPPPQARPPPPRLTPASVDASRPKSILGGLVSTGWSALAKSVTIPDEDPEMLYGGTTISTPQQPMLYRKPEPVMQAPKLYREPEPPISNAASSVQPPPPQGLSAATPPQPKTMAPPPRQKEAPPLASVIPARTTVTPGGKQVPPPSKMMAFGASETQAEETPAEEDFGDGWDDDLDIASDDVEVEQNEHKVDSSTVDIKVLSQQLPNYDEAYNVDRASRETADEAIHPPITIPPSGMTTQCDYPEPIPRTSKPPPTVKQPAPPQRSLLVDIPYNIEDDIVPTRKRWVNPRPNRSYLFQ